MSVGSDSESDPGQAGRWPVRSCHSLGWVGCVVLGEGSAVEGFCQDFLHDSTLLTSVCGRTELLSTLPKSGSLKERRSDISRLFFLEVPANTSCSLSECMQAVC